MRSSSSLKRVLPDLAFAIRLFRRRPFVTAVILMTIALGTGANTAVFSIVQSVLLRELPYPDAESLVRVYPASPETGNSRGAFSLPNVQDWAASTQTLVHLGAYTTLPSDMTLTSVEVPRELETAYVTPGFFEALGTNALHGRYMGLGDETSNNHVVVLSHALFQQQYGGDPAIIGQTLILKHEPYQIIGVMPPEFAFPNAGVEVWALLSVIPASSTPFHIRAVNLLNAVGRLADGMSIEQARLELTGIAASLAERFPDSNRRQTAASLVRLQDTIVGGVRTPLLVIAWAVAFVLAMTAVNVANLLLTIANKRKVEVALRAVLGASPRTIAMQHLVESLLLGVVGGALGFVAGWQALGILRQRLVDTLPRATEIGLDPTVFMVSAGTALVMGLIFGALPTLGALKMNLTTYLRGRGTWRAERGLARQILVALQVTFATIIMVGAGLLLRSFWSQSQTDPGFEDQGLLVALVSIPSSKYPERPDYLRVYESILTTLRATPGVERAAAIRYFPLVGTGEQHTWTIPERPNPGSIQEAILYQVSDDLFGTLGTRILYGREFNPNDASENETVVINATLADLAYGGGSALGRPITVSGETRRVVGIVEDIHHASMDEAPLPAAYIIQESNPRRSMAFAIRTRGNALDIASTVRAGISSVDREQPISLLTPASQVIADAVSQPRLFAQMLTAFGLLALILATSGVLAVVGHSVEQRRQEIGIRTALGANRSRTLRLVVGAGMTPVVIGLGIGAVVSYAVHAPMREMLFEVTPTDPMTYIATLVLLGGFGVAACLVPAVRALQVDPTVALRAM